MGDDLGHPGFIEAAPVLTEGRYHGRCEASDMAVAGTIVRWCGALPDSPSAAAAQRRERNRASALGWTGLRAVPYSTRPCAKGAGCVGRMPEGKSWGRGGTATSSRMRAGPRACQDAAGGAIEVGLGDISPRGTCPRSTSERDRDPGPSAGEVRGLAMVRKRSARVAGVERTPNEEAARPQHPGVWGLIVGAGPRLSRAEMRRAQLSNAPRAGSRTGGSINA